MPKPTIFLLSPAHCGGRRAKTLLKPASDFDLARRFHLGEVSLGEAFSYVSGLYFRGKLAYAKRFGRWNSGSSAIRVITSGRGLVDAQVLIGPGDIEEFASVKIDLSNAAYTEPLEMDARYLAADFPSHGRAVLLGSVATDKYVEPLLRHFGDRLCFPEEFAGLGDMQRGAMMLRAAEAGQELAYVPASVGVRSRARGVTP